MCAYCCVLSRLDSFLPAFLEQPFNRECITPTWLKLFQSWFRRTVLLKRTSRFKQESTFLSFSTEPASMTSRFTSSACRATALQTRRHNKNSETPSVRAERVLLKP